MTYASGQLITTTEYNTFVQGGASATANVACINNIWGTGYGTVGYGQSTTLNPVASTNLVTATQWSTMFARVNSIITHQTNATPNYPQPTAGILINANATVATSITNGYNNSLNFGSLGSTTTGSNFTSTCTVSTTTSANTFAITRTVTFTSADQARYFFNAGGQLTFVVTATTNDGTSRSGDLVTLAQTNLASFSRFSASGSGTTTSATGGTGKTGTGGTVNTNNTTLGYYQTTASPQTLVAITSTGGAYTSDTATLAVTGGAGTSTGGRGAVVTFTLTMYSAARSAAFNQSIGVTYTTRVDIVNPETTNLTNTWGTITIT
jgi:hypothetical protein